MRLTLPYQPIRWSMTAHCILLSGRWMMLKPIAWSSASLYPVSEMTIVILIPRNIVAANRSMIRGVRFQRRRVVDITMLCLADTRSSWNGLSKSVASKIDKRFSYGNIRKHLSKNRPLHPNSKLMYAGGSVVPINNFRGVRFSGQ